MLFSHLHLGLGGDLLTSDFRNITLYAFIFQSRCHVLFLTQSLWTDHRNENPLQWKGLRLRRLLRHGKNNTLFIKEYTPWSSSLCRFFRLLLLLPSWAVVIHIYLNTLLSICIFFLFERPNFTPDQTTNNIIFLCILIFTLLDRKWKDQTFLSQ
jgi:hypothetical protein